ncbi:hypothetical protein LJB92_00360 [Bacteroidales bacterium OttesenSCG-928-M06]|nr:hypothetical protein [Bacteroidales bacterium OttesenSCG-928-M06]
MKVLKKMRISEFAEMTDNEMKFVVGGSGSDSGSESGSGAIVLYDYECPDGTNILVNDPKNGPQLCKDAGHGSGA